MEKSHLLRYTYTHLRLLYNKDTMKMFSRPYNLVKISLKHVFFNYIFCCFFSPLPKKLQMTQLQGLANVGLMAQLQTLTHQQQALQQQNQSMQFLQAFLGGGGGGAGGASGIPGIRGML